MLIKRSCRSRACPQRPYGKPRTTGLCPRPGGGSLRLFKTIHRRIHPRGFPGRGKHCRPAGGDLDKCFDGFLVEAGNDKGFTLIELLIMVAAVSIILVSLAAAATRAVGVQIQARQQAQATKLAEEQIERIRAFRDRQGFAEITNCDPSCHLNSPTDTAIASGTLTSGVFTVWLTISYPPVGTCPVGANDSKYITAVAQWGASPDLHQSTTATCLSNWNN